MKSFTDLTAWTQGLELVKEVYKIANMLPRHEQFGLSSQLRRASSGILANIAEGFSKSGSADKAYKYTIARGECSETRALLHITVAVDYLSSNDTKNAEQLAETTGKLLSGLINKFQPNPSPNPIPRVR